MQNNIKYMLEARKPYSEDYCKGCLTITYDSDEIILGPISEEELIEELAKIESIELGYSEAEYDIRYFIYNPSTIVSDEKVNEIDNRVYSLVKKIKAKKKEEKEKLEEQKKKKQLERNKYHELALLKKLKEKYEQA